MHKGCDRNWTHACTKEGVRRNRSLVYYSLFMSLRKKQTQPSKKIRLLELKSIPLRGDFPPLLPPAIFI